jgi:enamine deaminase RidA (YjgF/YER057c/UK114 family)
VPQQSVQKLPTKPRRGNGLPKQRRSNVLQPAGWPQPKGYANGIKAKGEMVFVGGMIGWDAKERFPDGFVAQTRQAWYVVDMSEYRAARAELGAVYREVIGPHFPAMALVEVRSLVEPLARVEIEATAVVP